MKQFMAFMKKELFEQLRTGKFMLFAILFGLFGILNPAIAKLTPWLMELMSDQLEQSGMTISHIEVNALTSWTQYFKNMPMALLVTIIAFSSILTAEYQKGTLVLMVTKGMKRWKILAAKSVCMIFVWTLGCLLSYWITYGYNALFWDNDLANNLFFAAFCYYLLGLWLISIIPLSSALFQSNIAVTLSAGCAFLVSYLLGFIPRLQPYLPTHLLDAAELLAGTAKTHSYLTAIFIAVLLVLLQLSLSVPAFNQKTI